MPGVNQATDLYLAQLDKLLVEHYTIWREGGVLSRDLVRHIEGYLSAARQLDAMPYQELDAYIETVHRRVFGMSRAERRAAHPGTPPFSDEYHDIPTYQRKGKVLHL